MGAVAPLILSFGSVNIDVTARGTRLPGPGETVHADTYAIGLGGKGGNQAAAVGRLARGLGIEVALAGRVGADAFGAQARTALEAFGVDLSPLRNDSDNPTGVALIGIDATGENCITVVGGANMAVDASDVRAADAWLQRATVLLVQLEVPVEAVLMAARCVRLGGGRVVFDPAPAPLHGLPDALWAEIDVITPNESETFTLTGFRPETIEDAEKAARQLVARGAGAALVKMGANGVFWFDGVRGGHVPAFPVAPVDTVAAGDCFNAGLAVALAQGGTLEEAARTAAACGALSTTKHGAAESAPEWLDVQALLEHSS